MAFDVDAIRQDFPILNREVHGQPLVYFDNAASSQRPSQVIDRISQFYGNEYSNVHRGIHSLSEAATTEFERVRGLCRRFINASLDEEIIFVDGTTEAINLVAQSFGSGLKAGDEIVLTEMEHHSNIVPWQLLRSRTGIELRILPVLDSGALDMAALPGLLNSRTRLVSVVHTSNSLGVSNPVKEIIRQAHEVGAKVLVDGAQAAPHVAVDVQDLDCDFFAFSGHKAFAPNGIGVLYGKKALLDAMPPWQGGGDMIEEVTFEHTTFNHLPHKFEAGTPNIAGVIGLGAALDYLGKVDRTGALAHEQALLAAATGVVRETEGARILGDVPDKAAVVSFVVDGVHPQDIGTLLDQQGIAVRTGHHCTMPLMARFGVPGTVRASFSMYNTLDEVETFGRALQKVCGLLR